jgi:replicative DNA helicase
MSHPPAPPQDLEAEQAVLGAVLLSENFLTGLEDEGLTPDHFYRPNHGTVFATMQKMREEGVPIDALTLKDRLGSDGVLRLVGGAAAIDFLAAAVPGISNSRAYAQTVIRKAVLRWRLHAAYDQIQAVQDDDDVSWQKAMANADLAISSGRSRDIDIPDDFLNWYESPQGLPTPFPRLTEAIGGGLVPGEISVCSGWPSMGKTIVSDMFVEVISKAAKRCHIFVNEMNTGIRTARMLARANAPSGSVFATANSILTSGQGCWAHCRTSRCRSTLRHTAGTLRSTYGKFVAIGGTLL